MIRIWIVWLCISLHFSYFWKRLFHNPAWELHSARRSICFHSFSAAAFQSNIVIWKGRSSLCDVADGWCFLQDLLQQSIWKWWCFGFFEQILARKADWGLRLLIAWNRETYEGNKCWIWFLHDMYNFTLYIGIWWYMYIGNYRLVYAFALCMYVQTSEFGASVKLAPNYGRTLWSFLHPAEIVSQSQCKGSWLCATLTAAKIHHTFTDNFPRLFSLEMKTRRFCNPQRFRHWISLPANTLYPISINPGECAGPCLLAIILAWAIWQLHYELAVFGSDRIIDEDDVTGVGVVTPVGSQYVLMIKTGHYLVTSTSWVTFNFI